MNMLIKPKSFENLLYIKTFCCYDRNLHYSIILLFLIGYGNYAIVLKLQFIAKAKP